MEGDYREMRVVGWRSKALEWRRIIEQARVDVYKRQQYIISNIIITCIGIDVCVCVCVCVCKKNSQ